jgi:hypothetical protein
VQQWAQHAAKLQDAVQQSRLCNDSTFNACNNVTLWSVQDEVTIKLFTNTAGFAAEQAVYGHARVTDAVGKPPLFLNNADRIARTPYGFVFPPFMIAERGQPLSEWMSSFSADIVTSMQVGLVLPSAGSGAGWSTACMTMCLCRC